MIHTTTLGHLQATINHLLQHEGATLDTPVIYFADRAAPIYADPGPDGGALISVELNDSLDGGRAIICRHTRDNVALPKV